MNYQKIYDDLIESARLRPDVPFLNGYTETHHILPKSMGGSNEPHNLVKLTAREHFVAHWLLWRIHRNEKMAFAFHLLCRQNEYQKERYFNSRGYEIARKARIISLKGKSHSEERKRKISKSLKGNSNNKGKVRSEEIKNKMKLSGFSKGIRNNFYGKTHSEETKNKMSNSLKGRVSPNKGRKLSEETKRKMSEAKKIKARKI